MVAKTLQRLEISDSGKQPSRFFLISGSVFSLFPVAWQAGQDVLRC
jgi:hypothetical protein